MTTPWGWLFMRPMVTRGGDKRVSRPRAEVIGAPGDATAVSGVSGVASELSLKSQGPPGGLAAGSCPGFGHRPCSERDRGAVVAGVCGAVTHPGRCSR
jgi:hypothetical protein